MVSHEFIRKSRLWLDSVISGVPDLLLGLDGYLEGCYLGVLVAVSMGFLVKVLVAFGMGFGIVLRLTLVVFWR